MTRPVVAKPRGVILQAWEVTGVLRGPPVTLHRPIRLPHFRPSSTPGYDWTFRGRAGCHSEASHRRHPSGCWQDLRHADLAQLCPLGAPGALLWVREAWQTETTPDDRDVSMVRYAADGPVHCEGDEWTWRPAAHMPQWASRLTYRVVRVDVIPHGVVPGAWAWAATVARVGPATGAP